MKEIRAISFTNLKKKNLATNLTKEKDPITQPCNTEHKTLSEEQC